MGLLPPPFPRRRVGRDVWLDTTVQDVASACCGRDQANSWHDGLTTTMRAIETMGSVSESGTLTVQVPPDVAPGDHRVVVILEEAQQDADRRSLGNASRSLDFPVRDYGAWPRDLSLRREDIYGDDGR
jgi:hypothetical protein